MRLVYIFVQSTGTHPGSPTSSQRALVGDENVTRYNSFAREAAATLLRMAKTTKDHRVAAGLVQRAADLKDREGELPAVDVEAVAQEPKKPLTKN